ncbi:hypothetical protein K6119_13785 [Paracrocinitomix mangrovi]|uniref:LVIVD repeat-containing protein n=1 Tax=Paracrocinitomix mangrovi TaxID=2862509 RepID=UPI001C8EA2FE|nr:hypothetical protein [Paracrocinitomix mangrovi]UKN00800.1 hypothetical protein K6119_13785 [Paracrocinitomix mangrovi]
MKKTLLFLGLVVLAASLNSCKKYKNKEVYANVPVYMSEEDFRNSFAFEDPQTVQTAGNIFVYNNYVFVNDVDRGIHIFNNTDPYNPYSIGFMSIIGNTQIAVKGDVLYADSFMDLVAIDISNITQPVQIDRMLDVFEYKFPMIDENFPVANVDRSQGVVVDWNVEKTKDVSGFMAKFNVSDCPSCDQTEVQTKMAISSSSVALAGSMSKFAIINDNLYALDYTDLKSFNITNPSSITFGGTKRTWREPETLFASQEFLFVGTTTGMVIYDAAADPSFPDYVSEIEHVESCDPVVVDGDYAYLTLREGTDCGGDINELQVIDISNINFPTHKKSVSMTNPHGLGVDNNLLFICDGEDGLKVFDASNPVTTGFMPEYHFPNIKSNDIILNNGLAIMIADDGVYQYDYSDPGNIFMTSVFYF